MSTLAPPIVHLLHKHRPLGLRVHSKGVAIAPQNQSHVLNLLVHVVLGGEQVHVGFLALQVGGNFGGYEVGFLALLVAVADFTVTITERSRSALLTLSIAIIILYLFSFAFHTRSRVHQHTSTARRRRVPLALLLHHVEQASQRGPLAFPTTDAAAGACTPATY